MAIPASPDLITILTADGDVDLFVPSDIYRYDFDNRPLRNLILNDEGLQTGSNEAITETFNSRYPGVDWLTGTGVRSAYPNLKARLDDMESSIRINIFDLNQDLAARYRAQFPSGFFCNTGEVYDANNFDVVSASNNHIPFGAICVPDWNPNDAANLTSAIPNNSIWMSTHEGTRSPYVAKPIEAILGGYHLRLFNESANGATASGFTNGVSVKFNAAAGSGQRFDLAFLEFWFASVDAGLANTGATDSFYEYGAVDSNASRTINQAAEAVRGTVWFDPTVIGNYIQIRHRIRVVDGVDYLNKPFGINDSATVNARGGAGAPVAAHPFTTGLGLLGDPAIWVAGDGSGGDKTALGTFDGYVYAVPIMIVSRKNTAAWSLTNQNGGQAAPIGGGGRPDGYTHQKFARGDIIDLRARALNRSGMLDAAEESFDKLIRGRLLSALTQLTYEAGSDLYLQSKLGVYTDPVGSYGTELLEVNQISTLATAHTQPVRDFLDNGSLDVAKPTGFRRVFSPSRDEQVQPFHINLNGGATTDPDFCTWAAPIISLHANGNSGAGPSNARIKNVPIMNWRTSHLPVVIIGSWAGVGTNLATATVDVGGAGYDPTDFIDGAVTVKWPQTTSLRHSPTRIDYQDWTDGANGGGTATPTIRATGLAGGTGGFQGPTGLFVSSDGHIYVCDTSNHRIQIYGPPAPTDTTLTVVGQFPGAIGSFPGVGADNAHFANPQAISVDASGNIYVADTDNHRVVKLSNALPLPVYLTQFGVTGVTAADNTHLNKPGGVHAGAGLPASGNLYVSDSFNARVVKLDNTLTYVSQFGVTGVSGSDATHCINPQRMTAGIGGSGGRLIVADQTRVLVLNSAPNPPTLDRVLIGGQGYPDGTAITALNAIKSMSFTEDSGGNKYVSGGGTAAIFKFNSSWVLLAKYGTGVNDLSGLWYGPADPNFNTRCGVTGNIVIDEANGLVYVADNTYGISPGYARVLILDSTTLAYTSQFLISTPRPWMDGGLVLPKAPTPNYIQPQINIAMDLTNTEIYITLDSLACVEKWDTSPSPSNPSLWIYEAKFGNGTHITNWPYYQGWRSPADDAKSFSYPKTIAYDSGVLYVGDQNLFKLVNGHYAARVVALDANTMAMKAWFGDLNIADTSCDLGATTDTPYIQYVGGIVVRGSRVYVTDAYANPPLLISLDTAGWAGVTRVTAPFKEAITDTTWVSASVPSAIGNNNFLSVTGSNFANTVLMVNPGYSTQRWAIDNGVVTGAGPDNPLRAFLTLGAGIAVQKPIQSTQSFVGVTGVWYDATSTPNRLVISDQITNEMFVLSVDVDLNALPADFTLLGEAGTSGISGFGFGGWAHPTSVAMKVLGGRDYFYYTDFYNGSLQRCSPYFAFVERGTGRIECLLPPPAGTTVRLYSRFTSYQGVYMRPDILGNANHATQNYQQSVWASRLIVKPYKMISTTLGRVGVDAGGLITETAYASPLSHLPLPAVAATEYSWQGDKLQFVGDIIEPSGLAFLPIVQTGSQPQEWDSDSESFYERSTRIGRQLAVLAHGGASSYTLASNEFPVIQGMSLSNVLPHLNYTWGVVDYYGELLLFVRGDYNLNNKNVVGPRIAPYVQQNDAVDLYRMHGQPFCKMVESRG